jgi:pSer/pThr/pTyr-binding forkhead associated (FHA) protein
VNCSRCGRDNPDGLKFCQDCGNRLGGPAPVPPRPSVVPRPQAPVVSFGAAKPTEKHCSRCGTTNPVNGRFCANCGTPLPSESLAPALQAAEAPQAPSAAASSAPQPVTAAMAAQLLCTRCRGANAPHMAFCQYCGARIAEGGGLPLPAAGAAAATGPAQAGTNFQFGGGERAAERAKLVVIGQDGKPGREYEIEGEQTDVGREEGSILLTNDPYVSPRHARLQFRGGRFFIRDLESVNGVYVRLRTPERLQHADLVLVGLEVLRFEVVSDAERGLGPAAERGTQVFGSPAAPRYARLCQRTVEGVTRDVYYPTREETVIGREVGDVVFTTDPFMSRRHAAIVRDPATSTFTLKDLGSSNGTYLGIRGERELASGDHVRIGQHLFRLDFGTGSRGR